MRTGHYPRDYSGLAVVPSGERGGRLLVSRVIARLCLALVAAIVAMVAGAALVAAAGAGYVAVRFPSAPVATVMEVTTQVLAARAGEDPALEPDLSQQLPPLCDAVPEQSIQPLSRALGWMRATADGMRLYDRLVATGICIDVADLNYNAGYSRYAWSPSNGWSGSVIVVDHAHVRSSSADVLGALLIHEATHIDRAVSGAACWVDEECTVLGNGVQLEEEIAAHAAEARWWIAMYGEDGKGFALGVDAGENRLAAAYIDGDAAFGRYVRDYRSSSREGEGIGE
jgi:hypothetical protein